MTTFLLLHGAFCNSWVWDETAAAMRADGHRVEVVDLPSSGPDAALLGDLKADVAIVHDKLDQLGTDAVVVAHSGGGMTLTELADDARVQHSVYLAALWPQPGQSAADLLGAELPDWIVGREDGSAQVNDDVELARQALCADVDAERFRRDVHPRYVLTSLTSFGSPSSAPQPSHPSTYIVCEQDHAIPIQAQEAMSAAATHIERLPSSHSPMLSMPGTLSALLAGVT